MVTPTSNEPTPEPQDAEEAPSVIDETSPEVLAQEAAFFAGEDSSTPESSEQTDGAQDVVDDGAGTESADSPIPQVATEQPAEQPQAEVPAEARTFSQEEWDKRQSSIDRQAAEDKQQYEQQLADTNKRLTEFDVSAQVEAYLQREIQAASQTMGIEEADKYVRNTAHIADVRSGVEAKIEVQNLENQARQQAATNEDQSKRDVARALSEQNKLSIEDHQSLLSINDPYAMQTMANTLGLLRKQAAVANSVPAETSTTKVGDGTSTIQAQSNKMQRQASLRSKNVLDMDDAEYQEWRQHAVGRG